jgi:hypothetical protein
MLKVKLEALIGKSIDQICPNNFHDANLNHCAHFVSHAANLTFDFNCKTFRGGSHVGANIRVHEVFAQCPKVGAIDQAPSDRPYLVFVTKDSNVNLAQKRMQNVPQKHIGIVVDNMVYHYSNSADKVVKWTLPKFLDTFQRVYSGNQELFYGLIPGSDLLLDIDTTGNSITASAAFELQLRQNEWFARETNSNSNEFYVGREVTNTSAGYFGIYQRANEYFGKQFDAEDYKVTIDHWAYLLHITGYCESKNHFNLINTYDRAKFTFGFYQLAAHTPNDNLILLFRRLSESANMKKYFPELKMIQGQLHRVNENGSQTNLETVMNTGPNGTPQLQLFMNFLNPIRKRIDPQEILHAARLIYWSEKDRRMRDAQVAIANELLQKKMTQRYHKWYDLDGKTDIICALIADIHHQGRASKTRVQNALNASNVEENLITINANYISRATDLRQIISDLKAAQKIGHKVYSASLNEFI